MLRSYLDLTIKFHDDSSFFTAFDVTINRHSVENWDRHAEFCMYQAWDFSVF